jgi:DNA-binding response OmpR family regulator
MVYGIVSRHGGTVEVDSAPGAGTTIRMRFPATERAEPAVRTTIKVDAPCRARVLLVDDEGELLHVLREALERAGHDVVTATSGSEGVARFREGRFDVVLTDLGMADVSGWEVARVVRKEGPVSTILGLVTGWGATISDEMVTAHGVNFVVNKPFDLEDLVSRVHHAIAQRGVTPNRVS